MSLGNISTHRKERLTLSAGPRSNFSARRSTQSYHQWLTHHTEDSVASEKP